MTKEEGDPNPTLSLTIRKIFLFCPFSLSKGCDAVPHPNPCHIKLTFSLQYCAIYRKIKVAFISMTHFRPMVALQPFLKCGDVKLLCQVFSNFSKQKPKLNVDILTFALETCSRTSKQFILNFESIITYRYELKVNTCAIINTQHVLIMYIFYIYT